MLTLSSGVKGFTTIHAGSARQALTRLRFIAQLADTSTELPLSALSALVSEAVDLVVHCARSGPNVRVSEILAVEELQTGRDGVAFTISELFSRPRPDEPLRWTGNLPVRAGRMLEAAGYDVRAMLDPEARRTRTVSGPPPTAAAPVAPAPAARPPQARPPQPPPVPAGGAGLGLARDGRPRPAPSAEPAAAPRPRRPRAKATP